MAPANRSLTLLATWLALLPSAQAASIAQLEMSCKTEIRQVEASIAAARNRPEYSSEQGRRVLQNADRWLLQARKHAIKSEPRNCVVAAQKARAQL